MNPHLPSEIATEESVHIRSRRRKFGIPDSDAPLGVALSGGGIRSATVSLGVFQYFAQEEKRGRKTAASAGHAPPPRARPLSRIDYLSSVSGGGYFATFFCSLFLPKGERAKGAQVTPEAMRAAVAPPELSVKKTEWELAAERATDALCDTTFDGNRMTPMRWLRENGRYLAPGGGGDYLHAAAVAARNFLGLHYVIAVSLLAIFLLLAAVRVVGFAALPEFWIPIEARFMPEAGANFWVSVWWMPAIACFALLVVPVGVAFFLAQSERVGRRDRVNLPLIAAIGIVVLCLFYAYAGEAPRLDWFHHPASAEDTAHWGASRLAALYVALVALLAVAWYVFAYDRARRLARGGEVAPRAAEGKRRRAAEDPEPATTTITRTKLSRVIVPLLTLTLAVAAFALVDTIGQSVYALWTVEASTKWVVGGSTIAVLIPLLKRLLPLVAGSGDPSTKAWVRVPMSALAFVAGVILFVAVASLWSALTHGLVWHGARPAGDPGCYMTLPTDAGQREVTLDPARRIVVNRAQRQEECEDGAEPIGPGTLAWLFFPLLAISLLTANEIGFINLSSLQRYYAGHLMRTYLRASIFAEDPEAERDVRSAARADDITLDAYYSQGSLAPLHFISTTLNQTVASGSQLVQRDRKGLSLAIGPVGFTVGPRSFVRWTLAKLDYRKGECPARVVGEPERSALPRYVANTELVVEPLSIGNWCAISGAAFTTGHGKGTTLGLSLLLALTNVRLGYWWNAEVQKPIPVRDAPADPRWVERLSAMFATQSYLLNEMFARYYGSRRAYWYLSDGGHFENTAAYELIRRRAPRIIVLDNGHDDEYAFDDVANMVRKARIDLDAEIEFFNAEELWNFVDASVRKYFATPEEFRSNPDGLAYATLARVRYAEAPDAPGLMLVVKPRVTGVEPLDILNYKDANPDFPQQSTTDQFYDEAQWESYRSLGYWIAAQLFAERKPAEGKWVPRQMFD
jgi:hypothetical protein